MNKNKNIENKVVVTGMGIISCVGKTINEFWGSLVKGESGIDYLKQVDTEGYSCKIGGEVKDFDPLNYMDKKEVKRLARYSQFAVAASLEAIADSEIDFNKEDSEDIGVMLGSGSGGLPETEKENLQMFKNNRNTISPLYVPKMLPNMASSNISRLFQLKGYSNTVSTACAAGTQAIGEAAEVIKRGDAKIMIAGGSEAPFCETTLGGFCNMHALTSQNSNPKTASKPFDKNRDGFVPSEGSGVIILESLEHAMERGKKPLAEITAYACTSDAYHLVQPEPEGKGASKAMERVLNKSKLHLSEIDYINAHATSTPAGDKAETLAIKRVFGEHAKKIKINASKSIIGHSSGGAGAMEAIACVKSIQSQTIHPTINLINEDEDCDLDYTPQKSVKTKIEHVLSNSFGFGGQNSCIIISQFNN
ncbi:MAG: beta-ketoacyl-ACP synthase II [Chloroflexota bacterium]|nr:beta-ketoacyl-ACP synthase II [Chloroflexota bacterium]|tara:strand:+ start:2640 stop:3899 length:1260 start_codon:yes stop_codon:yes gene_type:complete